MSTHSKAGNHHHHHHRHHHYHHHHHKKTIPAPSRGKNSPAFPVASVHVQLQRGKPKKSIPAEAPVYLSAALEYLVSEIVEEASNEAEKKSRPIIQMKDIYEAVSKDNELKKMVGKITAEEVKKKEAKKGDQKAEKKK